MLDGWTASDRDAWKAIGGRTAVVAEAPDPGALEDIDGTYVTWFAAHACAAAIVRPDWYLYGTARDGRELSALLDQLGRSLRPKTVYAAA